MLDFLRVLLWLQLSVFAVGDFAEVNSILSDVILNIPDLPTVDGSSGYSIDLTDIVCRDLYMRDASLTSRNVGLAGLSSSGVQLDWSIQGLAFVCDAKYKFRGWLGITNSGDVYVNSRDNNAVATATVTAPLGASPQPPTKIAMNSCITGVQIVDIDFTNGGFLGWILDAIEALLRTAVEKMANEKICDELENFLEVNTKDLLNYIAGENVLKPYLPTAMTESSKSNYFQYENDFIEQMMMKEAGSTIETSAMASDFQSTTELFNIREQNTSTGRWINELIRKGVDASNKLVPTSLSGKANEELRVNQWLRDFILEDGTGALILTSSSGFPRDGIMYDSENFVTQTTIVLDRVKLLGLDTLIEFSPFEAMGDYTLETNLSWEYLALELDVTMTVRPSTRPDAMIESTSSKSTNIVEEVKIILGVDGLEAGASLMTALNQTALENDIELGSLLQSGKGAIDCLLSTILDLEFATMSIEVTKDILTPSIEGLVSPGLDRLVSQGMDASFLLYEDVLRDAAPIYFQNELRPIFTKKILGEYILQREQESEDSIGSSHRNSNDGRQCLARVAYGKDSREASNKSRTMDFRDLLLPMEEAIALGGSGSEAYGDVLSGIIVPYVREELLDSSVLNSQLIPAMTKEQSGKEGTLEFNNVFRYFDERSSSPFYDTLDFQVSKITLTNLNTVDGPLQIFQPTGERNILRNHIAMAPGTDSFGNKIRYLGLTFSVYLEIEGENSPFQMKNQVDFSISVPSTSFSVEILANLEEKSVLEFPLKDIGDPNCWLAALVSDGYDKELLLSSVSFSLSTFYLDAYCLSASSPGCDSITEVLYHLEDAGLASSFRRFIISLVEDATISLWDSLDVGEMINDSKKHCPHSQIYAFAENTSHLEIPSLSGISRDSSGTVLALWIICLKTAIIVTAKNHLLLAQPVITPESQSPEVSSTLGPFSEGEEIVDWTNLSGQFGGWAATMFEEFRESLSSYGVSSDEENTSQFRKPPAEPIPRANILLQEYVLDNSGNLEFELNGISFGALGVSVSVTKVIIGGLDTINAIEPLLVVGPYEMRTQLQIDELSLTLECNIETADGIRLNQAGLVYEAKNVKLDIGSIIAVNTTEIGQIQLGSLFDSSNFGSCIMRGIERFEISKLNLTLGELESSEIEDSFSPELREELSILLDYLRYQYQNEIRLAIPLIAGSTMREIANSIIPSILESRAKRCVEPPEFPTDGLVDFRKLFLSDVQSKELGAKGSSAYGDVFRVLYEILEKEVMKTGASNRPVLNDLLQKLTKKQSNVTGTVKLAGNVVDSESMIQIAGLRAKLRVEVSDVLIENLDSVGDPLYFLRPVDRRANVLDNKLSFAVDSQPMQVRGTLALSINDGADMNIRNEIDLSFLVEDVTVQASILLKLVENSISFFPLQDVLNLNCWASTILPPSDDATILEGIQIFDQEYSTGEFQMEVSCKSCTSPDFDKFISSLYEPQDITNVVREQTNNLMDSEFVQRFLKNLLLDSKKRCPHHPEFDPSYESLNIVGASSSGNNGLSLGSQDKKKVPLYFSIANSVVAGCLIILGFLGKVLHSRKNTKWIRSLSNEGQTLLSFQQEKERNTDQWLDENTTSLFDSPFIPKSIRWGVPILLLVNTALYLWGHFGLLSVMNLDVTFAGQSFTIENFLEFRFLESTKKTYENGGAEMIVLLWICSGIWPYIKIILSLAIWMTPPKYLTAKRRRSLILWIDALARLSIIDIFTLIIGCAIFLVFIGGRDESSNEERTYYAFRAIIVPKAGCYCIIAAQRMSRVSSQFFMDYHEKLVEKATMVRKEREGDMSISQILVVNRSRPNTSFDAMHTTISDTNKFQHSDSETIENLSRIPTNLSLFNRASWKTYRWGHLGAILGGITILLVSIIGMAFAPAISLDISNVGGIALESDYTYEEAVSEYGVFLVISGILLKARFVLNTKADYIGLGLLLIAAGISIGFIFILKSYRFIKKKIQERRERRNKTNRKPSFGHEGCGLPYYFRLYRWKHMEIYFISLCIGVWQLGSIISYSIHLYCYILTGIFDILVSVGIVDSSEAQCNRIQSSLPGNLVIIIGSFLILLAVFYLQARWQYKNNQSYASKYVDIEDIPTLSLAWSQDKSKNKRYSHLTESLSLSVLESDAMSSLRGNSLITNPSDLSFSQSRTDSRSRSSLSTSSPGRNTSIHLSSSYDTVEEEAPGEDEIVVTI